MRGGSESAHFNAVCLSGCVSVTAIFIIAQNRSVAEDGRRCVSLMRHLAPSLVLAKDCHDGDSILRKNTCWSPSRHDVNEVSVRSYCCEWL